MTGLIDFSTDAASNDVAAPPINWQEGMPARVVNDSARNLMAALAAWHADTTGAIAATGGAANTLSLDTAQGIQAARLSKPFELAFTVDAPNTAPVQINADGTGNKPLRRPRAIELAPGDLQPNVIYRAVWHPGIGSYSLIGSDIPEPGRIAAFASESAVPPGWVVCDGRALSRTSYAALLTATGFGFGTGDGSTTFNVPDLRGRALFGADAGAGRLTGAGALNGSVGSAGGSETVALTGAQMPAHSHGGSTGNGGGSDQTSTTSAAGGQPATTTGAAGGHTHTGQTANAGGHSHSGSTSQVGDHTHGTITASTKNALGGQGNLPSYWYGADAALNVGGAGAHSHTLSIDAVADHNHGFTTAAAPDHAHSVPAVPDHTHTVPAVPAHTHTISADGGGLAHPNMPPGLVIVFAIKA